MYSCKGSYTATVQLYSAYLHTVPWYLHLRKYILRAVPVCALAFCVPRVDKVKEKDIAAVESRGACAMCLGMWRNQMYPYVYRANTAATCRIPS